MLLCPMDVLTAYPVRKSKKQKQAFREEIRALAESWGYAVSEEKGSFGLRNLILGDPEQAEYLVTAHYDTCARMPVPNLITPTNLPLFLAYQLLVASLMLLLPLILAVPVYLHTHDREMAYLVWYALFWVVFVLLLFGPANKHNANDNTSGVVTLLETARSMPENQRDKVCFVLFDLEEAGLIGSSSYQKKHKEQTKNQLVLNLDCVGDGDQILMIPTRKLRKQAEKMNALDRITGAFGPKSLRLHRKGFSVYPSDQASFPLGVGICALRKSKLALYMSRIHTPKDLILEETNVNLLRAALISLVTSGAAK